MRIFLHLTSEAINLFTKFAKIAKAVIANRNCNWNWIEGKLNIFTIIQQNYTIYEYEYASLVIY